MDVHHWIETVQNLLSNKSPEKPDEGQSGEKFTHEFLNSVLFERLKEAKTLLVKDIMIPRSLIHGWDADLSVEMFARSKQTRHAYLPVYRGDLDNVVGVVARRDLQDLAEHATGSGHIENLLSQAHFVSEETSLTELLDEFAKHQCHLLIVRSQTNTTVGLVALQDALELLFGMELSESPHPDDASAMSHSSTIHAIPS